MKNASARSERFRLGIFAQRLRDFRFGQFRRAQLDEAVSVAPQVVAAPHRDARGRGTNALILDPEGDGLLLADDAETRRGGQDHTAVAFVATALTAILPPVTSCNWPPEKASP